MGDGAASHLLHHTLQERHTDISPRSIEVCSGPRRSEEQCQLHSPPSSPQGFSKAPDSEQFSLFHQWQELEKLKCY